MGRPAPCRGEAGGRRLDERLLTLLDTHGGRLHALLTRLTLREDVARDLMQDLFLNLRASGGFAAALDPAAYARRAAVNLAMEWRRGRARERREPGGPDPEGVAPGRSPVEGLIDAEAVAQILDVASELPESAREAFVLRFVGQESYGEIGRALGKTPHQARGLCHAAVRQLRQQLRPQQQQEQQRQAGPGEACEATERPESHVEP